jgi:hypothetical protein
MFFIHFNSCSHSHVQEMLHDFLSVAHVSSNGASTSAFRPFWASLPWRRATFHAATPVALSELRAFMLSKDGAAVELLHALDWSQVINKVRVKCGKRCNSI